MDLNDKLPKDLGKFDYVFMLDVIEHLRDPENFIKNFYNRLNQNQIIIASTGNISFFVIRIMLLFGYFNYGNRGILDRTHTRLFTFYSFKKLLFNYFEITKIKGIPAPYPLALGNNFFAKLLLKINILLIKISKSIFSYQMVFILKPKPSLKNILNETLEYSKKN